MRHCWRAWFLRTQVAESQIWEDWKCSRLPPLEARSGDQGRPPGGSCYNSSIFFLYNLLHRTRKLELDAAWKSLSSQAGPPSPPWLSHRFRWQLSAGTSGDFWSSLYHLWLLLWSGMCSRMCTGVQNADVSPRGLRLGDNPGGYSAPPRVAPEQKRRSSRGFNGEELDIGLRGHQVSPWRTTSLVGPGGTILRYLHW